MAIVKHSTFLQKLPYFHVQWRILGWKAPINLRSGVKRNKRTLRVSPKSLQKKHGKWNTLRSYRHWNQQSMCLLFSCVPTHSHCRANLKASRATFIIQDPTAFGGCDNTKALERVRRHKEELALKALKAVQDFEQRYSINEHWSVNSPQWKEAEKLVKNRTYRRCLDSLEGLIVARMFELTKMNMSRTGVLSFIVTSPIYRIVVLLRQLGW